VLDFDQSRVGTPVSPFKSAVDQSAARGRMLHSAPVAAVYFLPANGCVSPACKHRHLLQQKSAGRETGQKHSALFRREHTEGDFGSRRHCWTQGERAGRVVRRGEFEGSVQGVNTFSPTRPKLAR
jgi:hypothetical protein